ncbi:CLUMA_CG003926, isoform A [Clunio marinus]|uniref:CLUMA_CG003926, isoform A n=1 Tax=Clunio marinus TaxID=568069 RepID=A0A1J1HQG2_9DIPT|nr:CLUMA_CG003926, isoform A [Clunio marinus]
MENLVKITPPTKQEIKDYFLGDIITNESLKKSSKRSIPESTKSDDEYFESYSSDDDFLSESFKETLQEKSKEIKIKKQMQVEKRDETEVITTSTETNASVHVGTPTIEEAKKHICRQIKIKNLDVTKQAESSPEINSTFDEFLKAKKKHASNEENEEKVDE